MSPKESINDFITWMVTALAEWRYTELYRMINDKHEPGEHQPADWDARFREWLAERQNQG